MLKKSVAGHCCTADNGMGSHNTTQHHRRHNMQVVTSSADPLFLITKLNLNQKFFFNEQTAFSNNSSSTAFLVNSRDVFGFLCSFKVTEKQQSKKRNYKYCWKKKFSFRPVSFSKPSDEKSSGEESRNVSKINPSILANFKKIFKNLKDAMQPICFKPSRE